MRPDKKASPKLKVLMISPRPFGSMGTTGTFYLAETYAKYAEVLVVSNSRMDNNCDVVYNSKSIQVHSVNFSEKGSFQSHLSYLVLKFCPDIVTIGSHHEWHEIVTLLKSIFPRLPIVFDIKSPLLAERASRNARLIRAAGRAVSEKVDLVMTRSIDDLCTWSHDEFADSKILEYPLGIRINNYRPKNDQEVPSKCRRFVYIGSIHRNRKINELIDYIAGLPEDVLSESCFHFYGSGADVDDLVKKIEKKGLGDICSYKGCLDIDELARKLSAYDAGIAWVPREKYDSAPSLKLVEYIAAGLLPLATDTTAHRRYLEMGFAFDIFPRNSEEAFQKSVIKAFKHGMNSHERIKNLEKIKRFDWEVVAREHIVPRFHEVIQKNRAKPLHLNNIADEIKPQLTPKIGKILLISRRPFGLMATPGTYYLADAYADVADVMVLASKSVRSDAEIVHLAKPKANIKEIDFQGEHFLQEIGRHVQNFTPQVVIIGNFPKWVAVFQYLKQIAPNSKYVFDVKTPCFGVSPEAMTKMQDRGTSLSKYLDLVMGYDQDAIETWLPGCCCPILLYPLGVHLGDFSTSIKSDSVIRCKKFVYAGSLNSVRKLELLISYFGDLPDSTRREVTLDIYGSGPAVDDLARLIDELHLSDTVVLKGTYKSHETGQVLSKYDAGIAWVPHEIFNSSPSLKLLEYMAAGLVPVAMDTTAHLKYKGKGFHIKVFSNSSSSFSAALDELITKGFEKQKLSENLSLLEGYDWKEIAEKYILPSFERLSFDYHEDKFQKILKNRKALPSFFDMKQKMDTNSITNLIKNDNSLKNEGSALSIQRYPDKLLAKTQFWSPPIVNEPVLKRKNKFGLRIAGIFEERLYQSLGFEVDLMPLTPVNWKQVLKYGAVDVLLMESIWRSATGHWHIAQNRSSPKGEILREIVKVSQKQNIPTVFWITKSHNYHENYKDFARIFDYVFCSDAKEVELLRSEGIQAELLLPCVQPKIYNPFRTVEEYEHFKANALFDGWADVDRMRHKFNVLKEIKPSGLSIFDSRYQIFRSRKSGLVEYQDNIIGCVTQSSRSKLLKYGKSYLTFNHSLSSTTTQQWMTLEAISCQLPVVHLGSLSKDDFRSGLVCDCLDEKSFVNFVERIGSDKNYKDYLAQPRWRTANVSHTISNRVKAICSLLGVNYSWSEFPKASLITPTLRPEMIPRVLEIFQSQTYPNKELILVINRNNTPDRNIIDRVNSICGVKMYMAPKEMQAGACLNLGNAMAEGEYCFRIDDDDFYGPNYILDMMLHARSISADIFAKPPCALAFEDEEFVRVRDDFCPLCIVNCDDILNEKVRFGGNSLSGRTKALRNISYDDFAYGAADSSLSFRLSPDSDYVYALMDSLNLVAARRTDQSSHTWKTDSQRMKSRFEVTCKMEELMI